MESGLSEKVKVWQPMHLISRCCADSSTVSEKEVCLRELLCFSWRLVEDCGLNRDAMKLFCKTTQSARVVITRKSRQKSTVSIVAKATLTLLPLLPRLTGLYLKLEWASRNPSYVLSFCEVLGWSKSRMTGQRFSLLPVPFMMGFTLALAHISLMVPNCTQIHADVRLVGDFVLSQLTSKCAHEHVDQSRLIVARCRWLNFLQSSFCLKGLLDPSISTPTASMCALARTRSHGARSALRTSLFGPDCSKLCRDTRVQWRFLGAKPTFSISSIRHPRSWWTMSVFPAANDWAKMDQIAWAVQQRIYATSILAGQAAPRSVSAHPEDVLLAARRVRRRERTILENASTHSLVLVG